TVEEARPDWEELPARLTTTTIIIVIAP
ncbi:hypothetical protein pipiens_017397, partial [Culex pipiens pipiens]